MEKITLPKLLATLEGIEQGEGAVTIDESLKSPARQTLVRMLEHCKPAQAK